MNFDNRASDLDAAQNDLAEALNCIDLLRHQVKAAFEAGYATGGVTSFWTMEQAWATFWPTLSGYPELLDEGDGDE